MADTIARAHIRRIALSDALTGAALGIVAGCCGQTRTPN